MVSWKWVKTRQEEEGAIDHGPYDAGGLREMGTDD